MNDERGIALEIALSIPSEQHGERLDRALAALLKDRKGEGGTVFSRASLTRWIKEGRVSVDGAPSVDPSASVKRGSAIMIVPAPPPVSDAIPEDLPLRVLHADEDVIVVDKAAGMVVHPAAGHDRGTLVNALLFRFGMLASEARRPSPTTEEIGSDESDDDEPSSGSGLRRPGIVHRLDRWTSGVMVVARNDRARESLMAQLAVHSVEREYLAIVVGLAPERVRYETLHGRHPTDRKRFTGNVTRGKRAVTNAERIEILRGASVVRCRLETGRTHQIRVHLSEAGLPLLADAVYGRATRDALVGEVARALGRQALHARVLGFDHPSTGARVRFEADLPEDMKTAIERLRP